LAYIKHLKNKSLLWGMLVMKNRIFIVNLDCLFFSIFLVTTVLSGCVGIPDTTTVTLDEAISISVDNIFVGLTKFDEKKPVIAVLNFASLSGALSAYVVDDLTLALAERGGITIVDRQRLDFIRQEEKFQLSGEVIDESVKAIGKKLGATHVVTGNFSKMGNVYRFRIMVQTVETASITSPTRVDVSTVDKKVKYLIASEKEWQQEETKRLAEVARRKAAEDAELRKAAEADAALEAAKSRLNGVSAENKTLYAPQYGQASAAYSSAYKAHTAGKWDDVLANVRNMNNVLNSIDRQASEALNKAEIERQLELGIQIESTVIIENHTKMTIEKARSALFDKARAEYKRSDIEIRGIVWRLRGSSYMNNTETYEVYGTAFLRVGR
jgi:TolB-like protein